MNNIIDRFFFTVFGKPLRNTKWSRPRLNKQHDTYSTTTIDAVVIRPLLGYLEGHTNRIIATNLTRTCIDHTKLHYLYSHDSIQQQTCYHVTNQPLFVMLPRLTQQSTIRRVTPEEPTIQIGQTSTYSLYTSQVTKIQHLGVIRTRTCTFYHSRATQALILITNSKAATNYSCLRFPINTTART